MADSSLSEPSEGGPTANSLDRLVMQSPYEIFHRGVDETMCIAGKFRMTWSIIGKRKETIVQVPWTIGQEPAMFRVYFQLPEEHLQLLTMSPNDSFRLSLRGAVVEKLARPPQLSNLAMQLVILEGVHIYWDHQGEERKALNTWLATNPSIIDDNNWFTSPELASSVLPREPVKRKREEDEDQWVESEAPEKVQNEETEKHIKKRKRVEAKRQKQEAAAQIKAEEDAKRSTTLSKHSSPSSSSAAQGRTNRTSVGNGTTSASHPSPTSASASYSPLDLQAGCRLGSVTYPAINSVRERQTVHLVGIVTDISPPRTTRTGEWMRFVHIIDPSNYQAYGSGFEGFKINCFAKRYEAWLPHPDRGDVLILRNVKVDPYKGNRVGVGYSDKLQWAAFSPLKGTIHHGPSNAAPKDEGLAEGGFGVKFSPFLQPKADEITYCVKVSDWWGEAKRKHASSEDVVVVANEVIAAPSGDLSRRRIHRLISTAGPNVQPDGYFDCTVEVLKGYSGNTHTVCTLYVTDYTRNEQMRGVQSNWCPSSLSDFVLQLEMWDAAALRAQKMRPGQYYYIQNARMRINSAGYPEGKVAQDKIYLLEEGDSDRNANLKSLLERKRKWQSKQANAEPDMQYQLIQDVVESKFFHCTVVLLKTMFRKDQTPCIYVTDYTSHPQLMKTVVNDQWAKGLSGRIVKITLSEEQKEVADSATIGAFYSIRKLRLKYSPTEDNFCGFLGGNERLIVALNPNKTDNEHLNGLLRRKEKWEMTRGQHQNQESPSPAQEPAQHFPSAHQDALTTVEQCEAYTRVKNIPAKDTGSRVFRILARAVDFHPLDLQDAYYQFCSRCKIEIPKKFRACLKCGDYEHEYVKYMYQLYIMLEDEDKNQLIVSVNNSCSLFDGLKRASIREDVNARRELSQRLKPVLGNLPTVHNALNAGKNIEAVTPSCIFEVDSWFTRDGMRAFGLKSYNNEITT